MVRFVVMISCGLESSHIASVAGGIFVLFDVICVLGLRRLTLDARHLADADLRIINLVGCSGSPGTAKVHRTHRSR